MSARTVSTGTLKRAPGTTQEPVRATYRDKRLARVLRAEYGDISLRRLAEKITEKHRLTRPLTCGTLHRALMGIKPKRDEWRRALQLPRKPGITPRQRLAVRLLGGLWKKGRSDEQAL